MLNLMQISMITLNIEKGHKLAQVKAFTRVSADIRNPLHEKIGRAVSTRLKRGTEWLTQASRTIESCTSVDSVRRGEAWKPINDETESFTQVIATLGRRVGTRCHTCRDRDPYRREQPAWRCHHLYGRLSGKGSKIWMGLLCPSGW